MSAFGPELLRMGIRTYAPADPQPVVPARVLARRAFVAALHVAVQPCPGSCSSRCFNHWCPAHPVQETFK